jgi:hypothetical protein
MLDAAHLQYKKAGADGLMGAMPLAEQSTGPIQYSEKLSPSVNIFLMEASCHDGRWSAPQATPEGISSFWRRVSPQFISPTHGYSARDTVVQAQAAAAGKNNSPLRTTLHPLLRHKLVCLSCFCTYIVVTFHTKFSCYIHQNC